MTLSQYLVGTKSNSNSYKRIEPLNYKDVCVFNGDNLRVVLVLFNVIYTVNIFTTHIRISVLYNS
jgi:hypothetical protein